MSRLFQNKKANKPVKNKKPKKSTRKFTDIILSWDLAKLTQRFIVFGLVIGLVGSVLWYQRLYLNDERRFWSAIENSMALRSVTRSIESGGTGNQVVQSQRFFFSPQIGTLSRVDFRQKSALNQTDVVTEGISIPGAQYSRYLEFTTDQTASDGSTPNLDSLIGKWEGNVSEETENSPQSLQTYAGELVSLVIFANLDPNLRSEILTEFMKNNVYNVDYQNIAFDKTDDGEPVRVVQARVNLKEYTRQLQKVFIAQGLGEFPPLNPDNYDEFASVPVSITISERSNNIIGVRYGSRDEKYSSHGLTQTLEIPTAEYGPGELEQLVQQELKDAFQSQ